MRRAWYLLGAAVAVAAAFALFWSSGAGGEDREKAKAAARAMLPMLMSGAGDPAGLIPAAQDYLRDEPKDASVWAALGGAYVEQARRTGDPELFGKAEGALERSLRLRPGTNVEALVGMGSLANTRHEFRQAIDWALKAKKVNAYNAGVFGVLSDAHLNLGELPAATEATQRMLDLRPGVASFTRGANVFEQRGRVRDAGRALHRALGSAMTAPDAAFCHHRLGEIAWNAGRAREALSSYERALKQDAGHVPAVIGKARALAALGRADAASRDYTTAVSRFPQPQYLLEFGEFLEARGRADEARSQYAAFVAQRKLMADAGAVDGLTMGQYEADHGDPAEAVRLLNAEWARRPSPVVADAYGWALHRAGRDTEALGYAERADRAGPVSALFAFHRGEIERSLGRRDLARRDLARALRINPHFSPLSAPLAKAHLAAL